MGASWKVANYMRAFLLFHLRGGVHALHSGGRVAALNYCVLTSTCSAPCKELQQGRLAVGAGHMLLALSK